VALGAVELERRKKLAVRHRVESVGVAADADEALDVRIPGRDVLVA
jgi:hypothetical protein